MTRKSFGKAGLKCFVCLLLSILAGILLMTCVYILPTGRMLTQADRSLPIFENEGTSFCWAPEEKSARLDGYTDAIMMQIATVCSVRQDEIDKLGEENEGRADFYICVPTDMTMTY